MVMGHNAPEDSFREPQSASSRAGASSAADRAAHVKYLERYSKLVEFAGIKKSAKLFRCCGVTIQLKPFNLCGVETTEGNCYADHVEVHTGGF